MMHDDVEVPAVEVILADEFGGIGLVDCALECLALADEFAAHVDVAGVRPHGVGGEQATLDEQMRIVPHDLAILAGAGLGLVGIDDEVARARVCLGHERPLEAGRKTSAATPTQARCLHLVDDPVMTAIDEQLGAIPRAAPLRFVERGGAHAVEVAEDAVAVVKCHDLCFFRPDDDDSGASMTSNMAAPT